MGNITIHKQDPKDYHSRVSFMRQNGDFQILPDISTDIFVKSYNRCEQQLSLEASICSVWDIGTPCGLSHVGQPQNYVHSPGCAMKYPDLYDQYEKPNDKEDGVDDKNEAAC